MDGSLAKDGQFFDASKPHPCERLARWTGQTNFWMVTLGDEGAVDTTQDAAALAFAEDLTGIPGEVLLAYWGDGRSYRRSLAAMILHELVTHHRVRIRDRDRIRVKRAILHGVDRFMHVSVWPYEVAAKRARMDESAFTALAKLTEGVLHRLQGTIQPEWLYARYSNG
ncbi:MAG: hypothetical protein KGL35_00885 [Bradyrhizobium sp.]|nr:hypothetical protein [Bradyrhizobium sp.]